MDSYQRRVIEEIRKDYQVDANGCVPDNASTRNNKSALRVLSDTLNSNLSHFVYELIQNADDVEYDGNVIPSLDIRFVRDYLLVSKNEKGFKEANVKAICRIGASAKTEDADTAGEKGIGCRSIFKAAVSVVISSNGYEFNFDKARDDSMGMLVPEHGGWPEHLARLKTPDQTHFLIKLESEAVVESVRRELMEKLNDDILLFLRKLRTITICDSQNNRTLSRQLATNNGMDKITLRCVSDIRKDNSIREFYFFKKDVPVTPLIGSKKHQTSTSLVSIALPCGIFSGQTASESYHAFCWLPIRPSGLKFPIQAGFRLIASREDLDMAEEKGLRNRELSAGIASLFVDAVSELSKSSSLRYQWTKLLPINMPDNKFLPIAKAMKERLGSATVFFDQDGTHKYSSSKVRYVKSTYRHDGIPLLPNLDPDCRNLNTNYVLNEETLGWLGIESVTMVMLLDMLRRFVIYQDGTPFQAKSADWHEQLSSVLTRINTPARALAGLPLVPLSDGTWSKPGPRVFFSPAKALDESDMKVLSSLQDMSFIDASAQSGARRMLLMGLGIKSMDNRQIRDAVVGEHGGASWPNVNIGTLVAHAAFCFKNGKTSRTGGKESPISLWMIPMGFAQGCAPRRSQDMYIEAPGTRSLSTILPAGLRATKLLHPGYYSTVEQRELPNWLTWLTDVAGASSRLRIVQDGKVTEDFKQVTKHTSSKLWLPVLVEEWGQIDKCSSSSKHTIDAAQVLRDGKDDYSVTNVVVETRCGSKARLRDTYLPVPDLLGVGDPSIKFLKIENEDQQSWVEWECLQQLGVVCSANSIELVLKALRSAKHDKKTDLSGLRRLYERLQSLLSDKAAATQQLGKLMADFRDETLIWDPNSKSWRSSSECVWQSDFKLHYKMELYEFYPSCESLFKDALSIPDANVSTVLKDIGARPSPTSASDAPRMIELLLDLSKFIQRQGQLSSIHNFRSVEQTYGETLKQPLIPVKVPVYEEIKHAAKIKSDVNDDYDNDYDEDQDSDDLPKKVTKPHRGNFIGSKIVFKGLSDMSFYLVCDRKDWENAFERIDVVACTAAQGFGLTALFDTMVEAFGRRLKLERAMSKRVFEEPRNPGPRRLHVQATNNLRPKMALIKCMIEQAADNLSAKQQEKVFVLDKLEVHYANHVAMVPYLVWAKSQNRSYGIPRPAGQILSTEALGEGRLELLVDRNRLGHDASFTNQFDIDLSEWLSIPSFKIKDYIRQILFAEDYERAVEKMRVAGIDLQDLVLPEMVKASDVDAQNSASNDNGSRVTGTGGSAAASGSLTNGHGSNMANGRLGHLNGQPNRASNHYGAGGHRSLNGDAHEAYRSNGDFHTEYAPDAAPIQPDRKTELAAAVSLVQQNFKPIKSAEPRTVSSFFSGEADQPRPRKHAKDPQTGLEGEAFVARILAKILDLEQTDREVSFLRKIWTSELRQLGWDALKEWRPDPNGAPVHADFTVRDKRGLLQKWLAGKGINVKFDQRASKSGGPLFHIEVKASKGSADEEFHMSDLQMRFAKEVSKKRKGQEAYLVFRVYDLGAGKVPQLTVIADPYAKFDNDEIDLRAPEGWVGKVEV